MANRTGYEVQIPNWDRYNPRSDRGGFSWFRMDNQFYLHMRQRKGYSPEAVNLMAFLIAECSSSNGKPFKFRSGFAANMLGYREKEVEGALVELETGGDIIFKPLEAALTLTDETYGRTDETERDGVKAKPKPVFDFEPFWKKYPRKIKRSEAEKRFHEVITSENDCNLLGPAIDRYAAYSARNNTEEKFILHMSTFLEKRDSKPFVQPWRDWLDPETGTTVNPASVEPDWVKEAKRKEAERKANAV